MADGVDSSSRMHLSPPPHQISKDAHGFDNSIPLSPQWLLPKSAESKHEMGAGGNCVNEVIPCGNTTDVLNLPGDSEGFHETHKKKDIFRPFVLDSESSRRDRWRDVERDTRSFVRKDHWRDGEKDIGDTFKRENSSTRHIGDARRMTSEWWGDSSNRDTIYDQKHESKWNTRWGPDDRGFNSSREKLNESGKYVETRLEKGLPHISNHGKDEREGEQTRPWRSSSVQSRGRGNSAPHQSLTPNKQLYTVPHGRGRGENTQTPSSHGRGWVGRPNLGEIESGYGKPNPSSYSRTKLLDVYRATNLTALRKSIDDFVLVPPITLDEPLDPLALCAPNSEEMTVMKGIEKGDVISSGAPQVTKDARNSTDFTYSRRMKLGSSTLQGGKEDISFSYDECQDGGSEGQRAGFLNYYDEALGERHISGSNSNVDLSKRSHSLGERSNGYVDLGWPRDSKDSHNHRQGHMIASSDWKNSKDPIIKRQPSGALDRDFEARKVSQTSPEELSLLYKDPQGQIQGPFKGIDVIGWFEAGYFGIDLPVCLDSLLGNSPWSTLGDVMPHLRTKAQPPPGFSVLKQNEYVDVQNRLSSSLLVKNHPGLADLEMLRNDVSHRQGSNTEAENQFLESLMSSNTSSSPLDTLVLSEGFQGYVGNNPGNMMQLGVDNGNDVYLMAKRMDLERQRSLSNPYAYLTGKDVASLVSKPEYVSEALTQQMKLLPPSDDNIHQKHAQNADMMSILQGLSDKPPSEINNDAPGWSNFPLQGGLDSIQNKIDAPPQAPFGFQQQRQPQIQQLLAPSMDNPSGILTAEKLLSSGLPQDQQLLNMLHQQYMLSQTGMPTQQMSPLDKMLLLKQQELLRQQHQQQLLSQVLSEHQTQPRFGEPSFGQLPVGGMTSFDPSQLQQTKEGYHVDSRTPISKLQDNWNNNMVNVPSKYVQEVSPNVVSESSSLHLPHQLYGSTTHGKRLGTTLEPLDVLHREESLSISNFVDNVSLHEMTNRFKLCTNLLEDPFTVPCTHVTETLEKASESNLLDDPTDVAAFTEGAKNPLSVEVIPSAVAISTVDSKVPPFTTGDTTVLKGQLNDSLVEAQAEIEKQDTLSPVVTEVPEPKKSSTKKSNRQKSSKTQSADVAKVCLQQSKQLEAEKQDNDDDPKSVKGANAEALYGASSLRNVENNKQHANVKTDVCHAKFQDQSASVSGGSDENVRVEGYSRRVGSISTQNSDPQTGQRAWKPALGMKPKSFLEIQMEEQLKAQIDSSPSDHASLGNAIDPNPWSGVVAYADSGKACNASVRGSGNKRSHLEGLETTHEMQSKKSHLHDLLAEEVLKKFGEGEVAVSDSTFSLCSVSMASQAESVDDDNFIAAKETKRSRKKSAKSKNATAKAATTVYVDVPLGSSPTEKSKSWRTLEHDKVVLPPIPAGPSLGDFVLWKGEPNTSPSPAWSTDSKKVPNKPSLRDILKEQTDKKDSAAHNQSTISQKPQPALASRSAAALMSVSASIPSKAASPSQISIPSSQSKYKADDELFWGPVEQSNQETNRSDFPHLASQSSWGSKLAPSIVSSPSRQKSASFKSTERWLSSSPTGPHSSVKGKRDTMSKHSEAMGFKDWYKNECVRLIGTKDTSFLEYCLKQSRSEAEMLLKDNNEGNEGLSRGGGKKKSKKGKKVSPSVLGFNVVSSRIMMGEIQTLEE